MIENPPPAEIRAARKAAGLTQAEAGALVHTTYRTWQQWETEGSLGRKMHPAFWELFQIKVSEMQNQDRGSN